MKRTVLAAGLAIVAFAGVCFTAVFFLTRPPAPGAEPPPPVPVAPTPQPTEEAPVAAPPPLPASRRDGGAARPAWRSSARARSQLPSQVPVADRVTRKAVRKALSDAPVQARLARCVDRDIGFGSAKGDVPRGRPATLLLELEAGDHDLRVVGVGVERWGEASDDTVSCAGEVLRGMVIAATPREPGRNLKVPFPLNPRREALAARR